MIPHGIIESPVGEETPGSGSLLLVRTLKHKNVLPAGDYGPLREGSSPVLQLSGLITVSLSLEA